MHDDVCDLVEDLRWSSNQIEVALQSGTRRLHVAVPSKAFWRVWETYKGTLRSIGIFPCKQHDEWVVCREPEFMGLKIERQERAVQECAASPSKGFAIKTPKGKELYEFQKAGVEFAIKHRSAYVADEMGLGKTVQAIGVINCDETIKRVLIVTKASLKENWSRECRAWLTRSMTIGVVSGKNWLDRAITILNYDILHTHRKSLRKLSWDMIVLDEVQSIKNRTARRTREVIGFKPSKQKQAKGEPIITPLIARRKICLSGTPIENRPEELWTSLHFLDPQRWPAFWPYANRFCGLRQTPWGVDTTGASNLGELRALLYNSLMIRRQKKDVLKDLPPKTRVVVELDFAGSHSIAKEEQTLLSDLMGCDMTPLNGETEDAAFRRVVGSLKGLKKAVALSEMSRVRHNTAFKKIAALIEAIQDDLEQCEKALVFFHHKDVGHALAKAFKNSVLIMGETDPRLRQSLCDKFQKDPKCRTFFGSIRACSEGLTLTAANLVIFAECDWSPSKLCQAEDRACRIGQKNNVLVKHYVVPGTIDAAMIRRAIDKQQVIDRVI